MRPTIEDDSVDVCMSIRLGALCVMLHHCADLRFIFPVESELAIISGCVVGRLLRLSLTRLHESILANMCLASNVLVSDDLESARLLSLEKTELKRAERDSRKRHLKRLQSGRADSFETSDIHLETLRALREFNSHIAAVAYPILYQNGQLLETRLIEDMEGEQIET